MAGYDPRYIDQFEAWESGEWDHAAIKTAVNSMDAGQLNDLVLKWKALGDGAREAHQDFANDIAAEIPAYWRGAAAAAVMQQIGKYLTSAMTVPGELEAVGASLLPAIDAASRLQVEIGDPVEVEHGFLVWVNPWDDGGEAESRARDAAARETMNQVYTPAYEGSDATVPALAAPPSSLLPRDGVAILRPLSTGDGTSGEPTAESVGAHSISGATVSGAVGAVDDQTQAQAEQSASGVDESQEEPGTEESVFGQNAGQFADQGTPDAETAAASTQPSAFADGGSGAQGRSSGHLGGDSFGSGARAGNLGSGIGSGLGGGVGSVGGTGVPGSSGYGGGFAGGGGTTPGLAGSSSSLAPRAGGIASGPRATTPMGGMMGGGYGRGGEDREHKTPAYLINIDNGNAVIGRMPLAAPPVIGA